MTGYEAFLQAGISLAPLGLEAGDRHSGYFCTPLGAEVFGWEGVDGIHCCFVEGFGEMVFAVNPMSGSTPLPGILRTFYVCSSPADISPPWSRPTAGIGRSLTNFWRRIPLYRNRQPS